MLLASGSGLWLDLVSRLIVIFVTVLRCAMNLDYSIFYQPLPLKQLTEGLKATKTSNDNEIYKLFANVVTIYPPQVNAYFKFF